MQGKNGILEGGQELTRITQMDFNNGNLLNRIIEAVNSLATNLGASAVGKSASTYTCGRYTSTGNSIR